MLPAHARKSRRLPFHAFKTVLFAVGFAIAATSHAFANDGGLSMGGTPRLLTDHPSVTMTSEVINIVVEKDTYTVDCRFVFTNHGPACTVRMGFPDEGYGAYDPDEEEDPKSVFNKPPRTTFTSFHSFVDSQPTATQLVRGTEGGHYWHTKMVTFPANSLRHVRDVYTQRVSGGIFAMAGGKEGNTSQLAYILHTGASWHGNIGRSEVNVTFRNRKTDFHLIPLKRAAKDGDPRNLRITSLPAGAVVWAGPCEPQIQGQTLHFVRSNWRPTLKDDLKLTYDYRVFAPR